MGRLGFLCVVDEYFCFYRWLVCGAEQADMESAELDLWTGLVRALFDDDCSGVEDLAERRMEPAAQTVNLVYCAVGAECVVDTAVLRIALAGVGLCGDSCFARVHYADDLRFPSC